MKPEYVGIGILVLAVIGIVFISGCVQQSGQESQQATQNQEIQQPKTEINLENNGLKVKISPTEDKKVSGVITVTLQSIPSETTKILVSMAPQGFKGDLYSDPNVIIQWVESPSVGQEILLDTTKVENGVYGIGVSATYEGAPESSPWIALVQTQVNVQN
ncbi:MAG: hypothetical protein DRP11_00320 [Candidatus Aenigmatarchaeota archaeon]|nr:MAG: hypothetical protein DRP11_00320 [Candidatus Aenigmarchaeota archaeon]